MKNHIFINNIIQGDKLLPRSDSADTITRFFKIVIKKITFKPWAYSSTIFITETARTTDTALPRAGTTITNSANTVIAFRMMPAYQNYHPL